MEQPQTTHDAALDPSSQAQPPQQPQTVSPEESIFSESDYSMEGYDKHIRYARNVLFVVATIQLLGLFGIKNGAGAERTITIGIVVFIALVFAGLALWTKRKPYAALLTALIFYGSLLILSAVFEPSSIFSGLFIKIGVIVALLSGLRNAKEGEDLKKTFGQDQ